MAHIPPALRGVIAERAQYRCEYCQSPERITGGPMHVEHVFPETLGGPTTPENLAFACARCNLHKSIRTRFRDPVSGWNVSLFNPRTQGWSRHFVWTSGGLRIEGRTQSGRATINALHMNHPTIVLARSLWVGLGVHPPR
ncbi:MAG: HNH endonuclease [Deltaproteobacteria bacterium]|nr:HNH endonuclease [Deltaproteobacteria bacterium]